MQIRLEKKENNKVHGHEEGGRRNDDVHKQKKYHKHTTFLDTRTDRMSVQNDFETVQS